MKERLPCLEGPVSTGETSTLTTKDLQYLAFRRLYMEPILPIICPVKMKTTARNAVGARTIVEVLREMVNSERELMRSDILDDIGHPLVRVVRRH
jgi:hypothetical protein